MKNEKPQFKIKNFYFFVIVFTFSFLFFNLSEAHASNLFYVSDLISTSAPSATSTHTIQFTTQNSVPPSGKIIITPESGDFYIPPAFDYSDIDFAVYSGGSYVDRPIAATSSAVNDGVSVVAGYSGSVNITLNSTQGLAVGDAVQVELGTNASFGEVGDLNIINPSATTSHHIYIRTEDQAASTLDNSNTMIAIVDQISVGPIVILAYPPVRSNGLPSGEVAAGNELIEISLNTNEQATCRYDTSSGVDYYSMAGEFSATASSTLHSVTLSGFDDANTYNYYVRCIDLDLNRNTDDYVISFTLKDPPPAGSTGGGGEGGLGSGGGGGGQAGFGRIIGGSQQLFLSGISLEGWSYPLSVVTVLKDGEMYRNIRAGDDGSFSVNILGLERGTYTFTLYSTDTLERKSASFSSTITIRQGTNNSISQIVIPPTIELNNNSVEIGEEVVAFGEAISGSIVELSVKRQGEVLSLDNAVKFFATSTLGVPQIPDGVWAIPFSTITFEDGTYEVSARALVSDGSESEFSKVLFLGVGGEPKPDFSLRADLNKDGSVNFVDFSILLVYWGTSDATSDINSDGLVDLVDFSIMLFHWTG